MMTIFRYYPKAQVRKGLVLKHSKSNKCPDTQPPSFVIHRVDTSIKLESDIIIPHVILLSINIRIAIGMAWHCAKLHVVAQFVASWSEQRSFPGWALAGRSRS